MAIINLDLVYFINFEPAVDGGRRGIRFYFDPYNREQHITWIYSDKERYSSDRQAIRKMINNAVSWSLPESF